MCDPTKTPILNISFIAPGDEINWFNNTANPINIENEKLILRPSGQGSVFSRTLGAVSGDRDRFRMVLNFEAYRPALDGAKDSTYIVQVLHGGKVIGQYIVPFKSIAPGQIVKYSLDRTIKNDGLSGNFSLKIMSPTGFENEIRISSILAEEFNFCTEKVRSYFILQDLFEKSLSSQTSAIRLNRFKIDGIETLTNAFLAYNTQNLGHNPEADWLFGRANLDGQDRQETFAYANTFNPFVAELGLTFGDAAYHGGNATETTDGQDYGSALFAIGVDKPEILNALQQVRKGAFYLDIDYTKGLFMDFDVVINNVSDEVFTDPDIYRNYRLVWDFDKKKTSFFYIDKKTGVKVDQLANGFLAGATGEQRQIDELAIGQRINYGTNERDFDFYFDVPAGEGNTGIEFDTGEIPTKIDILDGNDTYTTNYLGKSENNQYLLNALVPANLIKTTADGNGKGKIIFFKPTGAKTLQVKVSTPVLGALGYFKTLFSTASSLEIGVGGCADEVDYTDSVFMALSDPEVFEISDGLELFQDEALSIPFNGHNQTYKARLYGKNGLIYTGVSFKVGSTGIVSETTTC